MNPTTKICETAECTLPAKLKCPTCLKLGIQNSFFCSQECFKGSWPIHKLIHQFAAAVNDTSDVKWPNYTFRGKLRPWRQTERRTVPEGILRPDYADNPDGIPVSEEKSKRTHQIISLNDEEIEAMRVACRLGREVLDAAYGAIGVGVTTDEIDRVVHETCIELDCYPSTLNYYGFPKSCCTSINEVICHGIPDLRPLEDGDICNVDVTVFHRGYHGDLNETFLVGNVSDVGKKLVRTTHECLQKAIEAVRPGEKYRELGNIIQKHAQSKGFSVVRCYCGHGIHRLFHTAPSIPHYAKNKVAGVMKAGHCFTIEPMVNQGSWQDETWPDKWTATTIDGLLSAQFEETLLVTDTGVEVLTRRRQRNGQPYFMDSLGS